MNNVNNFIIRCLFIFEAICISLPAIAQTPSDTLRNAIPIVTPGAYTAATINYIRTRSPNMPISDSAVVISTSRTVAEVAMETQYVDGLGRILQRVSKGLSPGGRDLITPIIYDEFGREQFQYLPYVQQTGNTNDGKFKSDPFAGQNAFYNNRVLNPGVLGDTVYYSRIDYDASPINRPLAVYGPGDSWSKNDISTVERGGNRPIRTEYLINKLSDSVRIWSMPVIGAIPTSTSIYPAGRLKKTVITDERGGRIVEYVDKDGQLLLRKVQISINAGTAHVGWLCTYYVYDDLNNLRFIIPPLAVEKINNGWNLSIVASSLCFQYKYDGYSRVIEKRAPGNGPIHLVYDVRGRLVFSQDSVQRAKAPSKEWTVLFHDGQNRPVQTALYSSNLSRDQLQTMMDGISGAANPLPNITGYLPIKYTYYDDYSYSGAKSFSASDTAKLPLIAAQYPEPLLTSAMTKGKKTGIKVLVLGTNQWLVTSYWYNSKGREIQVLSDNLQSGECVLTTRYDFNGKVLSTYQLHKNPASLTTPQSRFLTKNTYDAGGRLTEVRTVLNDNPATERIITAIEYDELGQIKLKKLGSSNGGISFLDQLAYEYTIRGWIRNINKGFLVTPNSSSNWFGQELNYDHGFTASQFNGNISGIRWKSRTDGYLRAYGYQYDLSDRLTSAEFSQQDNPASYSGAWSKSIMDFSINYIGYDANGNILRLKQNGQKNGSKAVIDQLRYEYVANSNRLHFVRDSVNDISSLLSDFREPSANNSANSTSNASDYSYDGNGNLVSDANKDITSVSYNYLNLPQRVLIRGKGIVEYTYDATGTKLRKKVTDSTVNPVRITTTDYIDGFIYVQDSLQSINHQEGRIRAVFKSGQPIRYFYDYFIKDHLNSVRLVLTEQPDSAFYLASMEVEYSAKENATFSNIESSRVNRPKLYPDEPNTIKRNEFVARLNGDDPDKRIGPSLVLRVMAGDTVSITAKAFFRTPDVLHQNRKSTPLEEMASALLRAIGPGDLSMGKNVSVERNASPFNNEFWKNDFQRLRDKELDNNTTDSRPKAFLNFVLFDDQFKIVDENSGVRQVKAVPDEVQVLGKDKMVVQKSGFLYVYTSNETPQDVFFDEVMVASLPGPVLEVAHYYPFGLIMDGISSKAVYKGENKNERFQGQPLDDDLGLGWYGFKWRNHDPQIGRFAQLDPLSEDYVYYSPYSFSGNKVVGHVELEGLEQRPSSMSLMFVANLFRDDKNKIPTESIEIQQRTESQVGGVLLPTLVAAYMSPQYSIPYMLTMLTGAPAIPAPQALSTTAVVESGAAGASNALDDVARAEVTATTGAPLAPTPTPTKLDGSFSIIDWSKYPTAGNVPKPQGPFRLLDDIDYIPARKAANRANDKIHRTDPSTKGFDIHEIQPVKFGGSPTDPANKIPLTRTDHIQYTNWWNMIQRSIEKK